MKSTMIDLMSQIIRANVSWIVLNINITFSSEHRRFFEKICNSIGVYKKKPHIKLVGISEIVKSQPETILVRATSEKWQVSTLELASIIAIAIDRKIGSFFEFGTFDGRTSLNIARNLPETKIITIDLPMHSADLPDNKISGGLLEYGKLSYINNINRIYGNTLDYDFSNFHGGFDLVFIDAGHSYECAYRDSISALRLIEGRDAAIIWHDYANIPDVTRAVEDIMREVGDAGDFYWIENTSLAVMIAKPKMRSLMVLSA